MTKTDAKLDELKSRYETMIGFTPPKSQNDLSWACESIPNW